ncbi:MAG: right-handed parallel beta-helix repeat-containing protein, partial [Gemmatimonadales bacterium]
MPTRILHREWTVCTALLVLALAACSGDTVAPPPPPPPPPPVVVAVTPATVSLGAGGTQAFTASVANATNTAVTWAANGGTITGTGASIIWVAPATGGSFTITATSAADPTKSGSATATVTPAAVTILPATVTLFRLQPQAFTATVAGVASGEPTGVTWTTSCGTSTPDAGGLSYTAPAEAGSCMVTATSVLDPTKSASATVTVRPDWLVNNTDDASDGACTWTHCSLREALTAANATPALDTILLGTPAAAPAGGTGVMAAPLTGTITLTSALPVITAPVALIGPGAASLTINANASPGAQRRVLNFDGDFAAVVRGLTLTGGVASGAAGVALGAGVDVSFIGVIITGNESLTGAGGGMGVVGGSTARLENSSVTHNTAGGQNAAGGGISVVQNGTLVMTGGSVSNNSVPLGWAGGIRLFDGSVTLNGVAVNANSAMLVSGGGGIMAEGTGSLTLQNGSVSGNTTAGGGGGIWVRGDIATTISGTTVADNTAGASGGGLQFDNSMASIVIQGATVTGNT